MDKQGRNDPCRCGSGKKFKKCCLSKLLVPIGEERRLQERLFSELVQFSRKNFSEYFEEAERIFWDDEIPEDYLSDRLFEFSFINFQDWMLNDWIVEDDKTLIDIFMETHPELDNLELEMLDRMRQSFISLFEVREIVPGKILVLEDLLLSEKYEVAETFAYEFFREKDVFAARILKIDGKKTVSLAVYPYDKTMKNEILAFIHDKFAQSKKNLPELALRKFLKEEGYWFNIFWFDLIAVYQLAELVKAGNGNILLSKAVFDIKDENLVIQRLKAVKKLFFEEACGKFAWSKNAKKNESAILGIITVTPGRLILDCMSKKRLEEGKSLIAIHVGDAAVHKSDLFIDPNASKKSKLD